MVSIIMGAYNCESTLHEAIRSILDQTYGDWELIVCDDCSTDSTLKILNQYASKDKRIVVIKNKKNVGLAASLNHCLKYVKGNYIARMDSDDISVSTRLEAQVKFLDAHLEYDLVGTLMQNFDDYGVKEVVNHIEIPTKFDLPKGATFFHATVMMRKKVMETLNGYNISKHTIRTEDVDLWYRFFAAGFRGYNIQEPLYLVRTDENAYKRRKLKYMFHASYIIWYGCKMLELPLGYRIYCVKPILSWIFPSFLKQRLRRIIIRK